MSITKQIFGLLINSVTQFFSPTLIRISGDETVANQLRIMPDGMFQSNFPERLILIANHQVCNFINSIQADETKFSSDLH